MIELCTAFLAISSSYGLLGMKMVEVSQSAVLEETGNDTKQEVQLLQSHSRGSFKSYKVDIKGECMWVISETKVQFKVGSTPSVDKARQFSTSISLAN